jgi:uncharacterized membrane protein AbrB (regulator of aidB expression)
MNFPASWMFGAMIASSVLHGTGVIEGGVPPQGNRVKRFVTKG